MRKMTNWVWNQKVEIVVFGVLVLVVVVSFRRPNLEAIPTTPWVASQGEG